MQHAGVSTARLENHWDIIVMNMNLEIIWQADSLGSC
jgi:hypothetical protein